MKQVRFKTKVKIIYIPRNEERKEYWEIDVMSF